MKDTEQYKDYLDRVEKHNGVGEALERLRKSEDFQALVVAFTKFREQLAEEIMDIATTPTLESVRYMQAAYVTVDHLSDILINGYQHIEPAEPESSPAIDGE